VLRTEHNLGVLIIYLLSARGCVLLMMVMDPAKYVLGFGDLCGHYHTMLVPCVLGSCMH
jgi:hypothetical protein